MKIISKYRDYYDRISDIYEVDEKIVLDRRKNTQFRWYSIAEDYYSVYLHICGVTYPGMIYNGKIYWLDQMLSLGKDVEPKLRYKARYYEGHIEYLALDGTWFAAHKLWIKQFSSDFTYSSHGMPIQPYTNARSIYKWYNGSPIDDPIPVEYRNTAIYMVSKYFIYNNGYILYPKLADLGVEKFLPAQQIYQMLSAYLAPKDPEPLVLSDKEKIISKGFDVKSSFRPKIK